MVHILIPVILLDLEIFMEAAPVQITALVILKLLDKAGV
jgi:hypothetical protein